jgi:chaperonin GroEL
LARAADRDQCRVSVVIAKIFEKESNGYGYDAQAGEYGDLEYGDLMSKGIIDPAKVVRAALQGAARRGPPHYH